MTLFIPDVSGWNAGINLTGALAVTAKATQGTGYTSPAFTAQREEAARRGTFFAAYHFLEEGNAAAQAAHALAVTGKGTPLMIDCEPMDPPNGASYPSLADACAFTDHYRAGGGTVHMIYLPRWYWARNANGLRGASLKPLTDRGLLLWSSAYGAYTDASDGTGWMPYGGMKVTFWQYSSSMRFGGLANVDFSAFRGTYPGKQDARSVAATLAQLRSLMLTGKYPASPAPPPPPLPAGDVRIPAVRGMNAARAHNVVSAAHLEAVNPGVPATAIVTGTSPGGTVKLGTRVTIHAAPAPVLDSPATGDWVVIAQEDLNKGGAHLAVDGKYGPATVQAAGQFQVKHNLALDGVIGKITWAALGDL